MGGKNCLEAIFASRHQDASPGPLGKGPKIEKIQDRPPGLKISIEIEIFKRATQRTPIFVGNSEGPGLKISIEIEIFKRD